MGFTRLCDSQVSRSRKITHWMGQVVHIFFIFCAVFGVFSRHFRNGGVQLVAYTVVNLYVYAICIINWPVLIEIQKKATGPEEQKLNDYENANEEGGDVISPVKKYGEPDDDGIELRSQKSALTNQAGTAPSSGGGMFGIKLHGMGDDQESPEKQQQDKIQDTDNSDRSYAGSIQF